MLSCFLKIEQFQINSEGCIVITVTCPCRGLAEPRWAAQWREGDVASFGGDWTSPSVEWAAAPCAAWPTRGFQRHSILLGNWGYRWRPLAGSHSYNRLYAEQRQLSWSPSSIPRPACLSPPCVPYVSPGAGATLWAIVAGGCCFGSMLVTGSVAPWSKWWVSPIVWGPGRLLYHLQ